MRAEPALCVTSTPRLGSGSGPWRRPWWAPWTWAGRPPRSASCQRAQSWTRAARPPSACTAPRTASTHTAICASGVTKRCSGCWWAWCRSGSPRGAGWGSAPRWPLLQVPLPTGKPNRSCSPPVLPQRLPGHAGPGRPVRVPMRARSAEPGPLAEPDGGGDGQPRGLRRRHSDALQLLQLRGPGRLRLRRGLPAARARPLLRECPLARARPARPGLGTAWPSGSSPVPRPSPAFTTPFTSST